MPRSQKDNAESIRQAAKREALEQIGGTIAHELNNALTAILGRHFQW
jgi:signal transduction histidine kinase